MKNSDFEAMPNTSRKPDLIGERDLNVCRRLMMDMYYQWPESSTFRSVQDLQFPLYLKSIKRPIALDAIKGRLERYKLVLAIHDEKQEDSDEKSPVKPPGPAFSKKLSKPAKKTESDEEVDQKAAFESNSQPSKSKAKKETSREADWGDFDEEWDSNKREKKKKKEQEKGASSDIEIVSDDEDKAKKKSKDKAKKK